MPTLACDPEAEAYKLQPSESQRLERLVRLTDFYLGDKPCQVGMTGETEGPEWQAMAGYTRREQHSMQAVSRDRGPRDTVCLFFLDLQ